MDKMVNMDKMDRGILMMNWAATLNDGKGVIRVWLGFD